MTKRSFPKNSAGLLIVVLFSLAFVVRLYRIENPIADWHAWRQADTSAVSKRFVEDGIDILHPKYFDISNIQSGKDNPNGYRMVEFPILNVLQAGAFSFLPVLSLEVWGRLIVSILYLAGAFFLYLFSKKHFGSKAGFFALFYYLFLPFGIYYSRTILPDPLMISFIIAGIYAFDRYLEGKNKITWIALSFIFVSLSFLAKPYTVFFLPVFVAMLYVKYGLKFVKKVELIAFGIACIVPLLLWRKWIGNFPEGIPVSSWLFNEGNIRFKGAFFYWIFGERIGKLILGYFGSSLLMLGLLINGKRNILFYSFILSGVLYVSIIARGNVQHDYYQIFLLPIIAITLGRGASFIIDQQKKYVGIGFVLLITIMSFAFSWYYVRDYFNINNIAFVHAGQRADEILPKDARVIAPFDGDTSFLYYINRSGWPAFQQPIEEMIKMGATHLVIAGPTENDFKGFGTQYKIVDSSPEYLILDIRQ